MGKQLCLWSFQETMKVFKKQKICEMLPNISRLVSKPTFSRQEKTKTTLGASVGGSGVKTSTNLLLGVLHASHGPGRPTLNADWIPLWAWGAVGTSRVRAALLWLRMRVTAHAIQLGPLHHHGIHWAALWRSKRRHRLITSLLQRQKCLLC